LRINKFGVFRYGPLGNTGDIALNNFNILWGYNEKGKTLIVDALLKMLMKDSEFHFDDIDRVRGEPQGYVELIYKENVYEIPKDGCITTLIDGLKENDLRNVFIIRNSDLILKNQADYFEDLTERLTGTQLDTIERVINKLREIGQITDTNKIRSVRPYKLREKIREAKKLIEDIDYFMVDLRRKDYESLEIEKLRKERKIEGVEKRLNDLRDAQKREKYEMGTQLLGKLEEVQKEIERLESYNESDWERWINLEKQYESKAGELEEKNNEYRDLEKNIDNLKKGLLNVEESLSWKKRLSDLALELENKISVYNEKLSDHQRCLKEVEDAKHELSSLKESLEDGSSKIAYLEEKDVKNRIQRLKEQKFTQDVTREVGNNIIQYAPLVASITGFVSAVGGIVLRNPWIIGVGAGLGIAGILMSYKMQKTWEKSPVEEVTPQDSWDRLLYDLRGVFGNKVNQNNAEALIKAIYEKTDCLKKDYEVKNEILTDKKTSCKAIENRLERLKNAIKELAGKLRLSDVADFSQYLGEVERIKKEHSLLEKRYTELTTKLKQQERLKTENKKKIGVIKEELNKLEKEINSLKYKYNVKSPDELKEKVKELEEFKKKLSSIEGKLEGLLGKPSSSDIDKITYWKDIVKSYEEYKDKAIGFSYDKDEERKLEERLNSLRDELDKIKDTLEKYKDKFREIEENAKGILITDYSEIILSPVDNDETIVCRSTSDLKRIKKLLREFIANNERRKNDIVTAIEIFKELAQEENRKIADLFGNDSQAIEYFSKITRGEYEDIKYSPDNRTIKVRKRDGTVLSARQLSGGALDQLYFSIRLSLASKLLGDEKGFFILDDPFIKSDPRRLRGLFEILKELADDGWQILYFSSKGEVKELAEGEFRGVINYVSVDLLY